VPSDGALVPPAYPAEEVTGTLPRTLSFGNGTAWPFLRCLNRRKGVVNETKSAKPANGSGKFASLISAGFRMLKVGAGCSAP